MLLLLPLVTLATLSPPQPPPSLKLLMEAEEAEKVGVATGRFLLRLDDPCWFWCWCG